jgi:hypothetical protein
LRSGPRRLLAQLAVALLGSCLRMGSAGAQALEPGDLVVADRQGTGPARLVQIERATGTWRTIYVSYDGLLRAPRDIEFDAQRHILASQSGTPLRPEPERLVRFDPATGGATVLAEAGLFTDVDGLAVAPDGTAFVADHGDATGVAPSIVRVDGATSAQSVVTSGQLLVRPVDVAIEPAGTLVVLDGGTGSGAKLIRVQPAGGAQTLLVGPGGLGPAAGGVAVDADGAIVVLSAFGSLYRVAPSDGAVTPLVGGPGVTSTDLALEPDGDALVLVGSDGDRLDRVDRASGTARTIATGFTSPIGVAVVRATGAFCDVEVARPRYADGDVVRISTLRIVNPFAAPFPTRLRLSLGVPGAGGLTTVLPVDASLPVRLDAELAPFPLVQAQSFLPRGTYDFRCALEDAAHGTVQASDDATFVLE